MLSRYGMTVSSAAAFAVSNPTDLSNWVHLIQAEYREMPCLSLTKQQMQRLWGLEGFVCDALIDALVEARVLRRRLDGAYVAATR